MISSKIADLAGHLPARVLSNEELAEIYPDWPAGKIFDKTGISTRYIAAEDETASDLAYEAARKLFSQGRCSRDDVDFLIFVTQAPDYVLPTSACLLQDRLGLSKSIGAIDVNLGCSGYVYGLALAKGLLQSGAAKCVLLLTADTYSKYIHPMDKSVRTLFGDGATATAIVACEENESDSIDEFVFGTDGAGAENLIVPAGGYRTPKSIETGQPQTDGSGNTRTRDHLYMNGSAVMSFTLSEVPRALDELLMKADVSRGEIDYFVLHQANKFMLNALGKRLKVESEKLPVTMRNVGNTVSSSIPFALLEMRGEGLLSSSKKLALIGFGVGYSWAACLINVKLGV